MKAIIKLNYHTCSGSKYEDNIEEISGNGSLSSAILNRGIGTQQSGLSSNASTTAKTIVCNISDNIQY